MIAPKFKRSHASPKSPSVDQKISNVLSEDVLDITGARKELKELTGRHFDKASLCRWIHRGVGGVRLDAVRIGNQLYTSRQSIRRFIAARTR